jgi:mono/diheme cytochrome c family protein
VEVLHHVRTQRGELVRALIAPLVAIAAACGDSQRRSATPADTALIAPPPDTVTPTATDTASAPRRDSTSTAAQPAPTPSVVLRADSAAGDSVFHGKGRCFTCHGAHGEGIAKLGPSLADSAWVTSDGSLRAIEEVIANGVAAPRATTRAMPAFGSVLSPAELAHTAVYVYTLSHPGAAVDDSSSTAAPAPESTGRADTTPPLQ